METGTWANQWFAAHKLTHLSPKTESSYKNIITHYIVPKFEKTDLHDLTENKINRFYRQLQLNGLSPTTVWCIHLLFKRILDEACKEGLLEQNPAEFITCLPCKTENTTQLRAGQVLKYLDAAKRTAAYPILYTALSSGLRLGELRSLTWVAFDIKKQRLRLHKQWLTMSQSTYPLLISEYQKHPDSPYIFIDPKTDKPYTEHRLYYIHKKTLREAQLPNYQFKQLQQSARRMPL